MATHVSNFLQAPAQVLLDLINADNAKSLPLSAVTFDVPVEVTPGQIATIVVATAATGSGYKGSQIFTFNRVPLSFMNTNEPDLVLETEEASTHGLIPFLNTTFGIQLTTDDIEDTPITAAEPDVVSQLTITAKAGSLVWHGAVTLDYTLPLVDLVPLLTVATLDGLYPPAAQPA